MSSGLQVADLEVSIGGTEILRGANFSVSRGGFSVIVGPSGCGKSTLLRAIAGLIRPNRGRVTAGEAVLSDDVSFLNPERRRIGWVPQEVSLFPHLTVAQNVAFGADGRTTRRALPRRSPEAHLDLLDLTGLIPFANRYPDELSGGQAARVSLARALAGKPEALLLDEPFAALDPRLRAELRDDLRALLNTLSMTAVLVTHDQSEALEIADDVAIMRAGVVVQQGLPAEVYTRPGDAWTAVFLGETVFLNGIAHGISARTTLGDLAIDRELSGPVQVILRPEQLVIGREGTLGVVTKVRYGGHDALIEIRTQSGVNLTARVQASSIPQPGEHTRVSVRGGGIAFPGHRDVD